MLWEACHEEGEGASCSAVDGKLDVRELAMLAVATSIDALAVGVTFAFLHVDIASSVALIGATTFVLSLAGVPRGTASGPGTSGPSAIAGGVVLILIASRSCSSISASSRSKRAGAGDWTKARAFSAGVEARSSGQAF